MTKTKERCEGGCKGPIVEYDREGVPLCRACYDNLKLEMLDEIRGKIGIEGIMAILDGTAGVINGATILKADVEPATMATSRWDSRENLVAENIKAFDAVSNEVELATTPEERWIPETGRAPRADWPHFNGEEPSGRVMINLAVRDGAGNALIDRIGGKAADELAEGRAAVVPLTCIHPHTGAAMLVEEVIYGSRQQKIHKRIQEARIDAV